MDIYNDRKRIVGADRAIGQDPDRLRAKRPLDVGLARHDVGQVRDWDGAQQSEQIAQFRIDKFNYAHGWQPGSFGEAEDGIAATAWRQANMDFVYR